MMPWGHLLQGELTECDAAKLDGELEMEILLRRIVSTAGMTEATEPLIFREQPRDTGKGPGLTGLIGLTESHVAVHTYPERRRMFITLVTCGVFTVFDAQRVMDVVAELTNGKSSPYRFLAIGEDWDVMPKKSWRYEWDEESQHFNRRQQDGTHRRGHAANR